MNELEDRLRESLRDLAEPVHARVDIDDLRAGGDQLRRSRRNRLLASGVVGTAVVSLIAYGVSSQAVRAVPEPIGTVAPSTLPSTLPPSLPPTASATVRPLPGQVGDKGTFSVDLRKFGVINDATPDYEKLTISAERDASGYQVVVRGSSTDGSRAEESGHSDGSKPVLLRLGPKLWAGVAPDRVVAMFWQQDNGSTNPNYRPMVGLPATALIVTADAEITSIGSYVWRTKSGEYRDSAGNPAPSTVFTLKGRSYWFFDDADLGAVCWGLVQADPAGGPSACNFQPEDASSLMRAESADAVEPDNRNSLQDSYVIGVLPEGATDPSIDRAPEASQVAIKPLTVTGRLAFIVYGRTKSEDARLVQQVHYTDADGTAVAVEFK